MQAVIQPIAAEGRREAILSALTDFIVDADLRPGDRLPTERELMDGLKVGRSTVREVIRHLQALGTVEIRRGSGTYLMRPLTQGTVFLPLSMSTEGQGLLQGLEVRRGIEVEASGLAAQRATDADIAAIRRKLAIMEAAHHERGTAGPEDLALHLSIYRACGNPLFEQILHQLRAAFESFFEMPFDREDFAGRSFPLHRPLVDAIADHDAAAARDLTSQILAIVEEDIIRMSHER